MYVPKLPMAIKIFSAIQDFKVLSLKVGKYLHKSRTNFANDVSYHPRHLKT